METNKLIEKIVENRKDAAEFLKDNSLLHICENINKVLSEKGRPKPPFLKNFLRILFLYLTQRYNVVGIR